MSRYGDENYVNIRKMKETKFRKYGDENWNNVEKTRQTNIERYGTPAPNAYGSDRYKQAMMRKYGVEHNSQVHEFRLKQQQRYVFNGVNFASSPELALYIYLTDNDMEFIY